MTSPHLNDATASGTHSTRNPVKAIRAKCFTCIGAATKGDVRKCDFTDCALHPFRFGKDPYRGKPKPEGYLPPLKAIRAECLDCCCGSAHEVRLCGLECPRHE